MITSEPPAGAPALPDHPLDATRRRLGRTFRPFAFEMTPTPGERWVSMADAGQPGWLADRVEQLGLRYGGRRDVAAAYLAMRISSVVGTPLISAYLLERRFPLLDPEASHVRLDPATEFSRFAVGTKRFTALPDDEDAHHPDARVVDPEVLAETVADHLHRLLTPALTELRSLAPFGSRGLWGLLADSIGGTALAAARETNTDHRPLWASANRILDLLQGRGSPLGNRPRPLVVRYAGHEIPFNIRGTCCLQYKADEQCQHHDPDFGPFCHSCPLVDEAVLERHYHEAARARYDSQATERT